jgi:hypothetical protein
MSFKSELDQIPKKAETPGLFVHDGFQIIVLMSAPGNGIIVGNACTGQPLGKFGNNWFMEDFKPYKGSVILENE